MSSPIRGGNEKTKAAKESFFVRVPTPDGPALFFDASAYVGKQMPYSRPQATCAMRVEDKVVAFSLLHLTKKAAAVAAAAEVKIPRGPLSKLARRAEQLELDEHTVVMEYDEKTYRFTLTRDENQLGRLEIQAGSGEGEAQDEDPTFEIPVRALQLSKYLKSPRLSRAVAVGFIGHVGKPATPETIGRVASMVLNSICGLAEFRLIAGLEAMKVPAPPAKWVNRPSARRDEERVVFEIPVGLYTPEYQPVGTGSAVCEVDLEHANQATSRLLYHITPSAEIEGVFGEYRSILDGALTDRLRRELGDELEMIMFEVILGEVSNGTIERLREAAAKIPGVDLTTREYRYRDS